MSAETQGAAQGAVAGATAGAALGSVVPGVGTALGAAAGTIVGGVAGWFSGGGSGSSSGYTIPPEYELQLLDYFKNAQTEISTQKTQVATMIQSFQDKMSTIDEMIKGTIPSTDGLKRLTDINMNLATSLGMSGEELAKNGFLTGEEHDALKQQQELSMANPEDYGKLDPQFQTDLANNRARLDQDLRRAGASASVRAQKLAEFDMNAKNATFSRGQELQTGKSALLTNYLASSSATRQAGFGRATASLAAGQSEIASAETGINMLEQSVDAQLTASASGITAEQALTQAGFQDYNTLGSYKLSGVTKNLIKSGAVGPGTDFQQTGIARADAGKYAKYVGKQEKAQTEGITSSTDYSLSGFQNFLAALRQKSDEKRRSPVL